LAKVHSCLLALKDKTSPPRGAFATPPIENANILLLVINQKSIEGEDGSSPKYAEKSFTITTISPSKAMILV